MVGDPDLSIDEQVQFRVLLLQNMFLWERIYPMELAGGLEPWLLKSSRRSGREMAGARGFQLWFADRKHLLSEEFGAALEEDTVNSPGYRPAGLDPDQIQ
jgi:hypothetical protein